MPMRKRQKIQAVLWSLGRNLIVQRTMLWPLGLRIETMRTT